MSQRAKLRTDEGEADVTELEYWTLQAKKGRISRREFIGRATALGIAATAASGILSKAGVAATPKRGFAALF